MYTQVTPIVQPQKKIMSFKTKDISFFCSDKDKKKKRRKSLLKFVLSVDNGVCMV